MNSEALEFIRKFQPIFFICLSYRLGIVSDLFPRMVEEPVDYGVLEESIRASCITMGLEDVNGKTPIVLIFFFNIPFYLEYVKKVIQLYETTIVRHGLMLVGPTGSGKTKVCIKNRQNL